ncbi:MAG: rcp1 2 [Segetibacter sp.]|nr:rcp1 2 [Segetibacter sp.]
MIKPSSVNILITDDDRDDALLLQEALLKVIPSANCFHVSDGLAALRHIKTEVEPDLVFLDLNMPMKGGISCLHEIYSGQLLPNTPIVIYSTSINVEDIDNAYKFGASFYIVKPDKFITLCQVINYIYPLLAGTHQVDKAKFVLTEAILDK